MKTLTILLGLTLLASCTVGPNYQRPAVTVPETFRAEAEAAKPSLADQAWWEVLQDEALQALIEEALRDSQDLRIAAWRVEEARASAGIARSAFYPQVDATAGWARGREEILPGQHETFDFSSVALRASWEVDLWGRIRRLNEAARAQYLATEEARRGVELSLVSDVATTYFELRALDYQLDIAKRTAATFADTHALFQRRLEAGLASSLETASASASLFGTQASIPDLERLITDGENRLAVLLGRTPQEVRRGLALDAQPLPPAIPVGLPSDLLERRPDLRQAEQDLIAANAEVGVAVADFFPRISLTGLFGGVAPQVRDVLDSGQAWSIGAGILAPVFQGGRLKNQHRAAVARWEQAKAVYERDVNEALAEVSTALVAYQKLADVEKERAHSVAAYKQAVEVSNSRYLSGLADYFEVLEAQQQLFPAENALAQTRFARLQTLVQLYRALGGGWDVAPGQGERS
ncbi:MAG TPA: efflux transporter outer membrane subunit [Candidatus Polarisedimenticolaceae bacterium]|nr:efflux transporter outer membrane subunit [Candidatus Polarisedimenticolaceae bacterium]